MVKLIDEKITNAMYISNTNTAIDNLFKVNKHSPDCKFTDVHLIHTSYNPYGKDTRLTITPLGIEYDSNVTLDTDTKDDVDIIFNYCPICGCKLSE